MVVRVVGMKTVGPYLTWYYSKSHTKKIFQPQAVPGRAGVRYGNAAPISFGRENQNYYCNITLMITIEFYYSLKIE